jgi:Ribosomal protein L7/L12 C-terminal domain
VHRGHTSLLLQVRDVPLNLFRVVSVNDVAQVEKAPIVLKAGVKKEEAEELQKKLEAGGMVGNRRLMSENDSTAIT